MATKDTKVEAEQPAKAEKTSITEENVREYAGQARFTKEQADEAVKIWKENEGISAEDAVSRVHIKPK